eukprot:GHVU01167920.1.p2 GENE.GHVU01167920.1~~GHVU01167920.1.p2  ORF type:complete len:132 (+),score=1.35 GHVU01167920.1:1070-1465(+)
MQFIPLPSRYYSSLSLWHPRVPTLHAALWPMLGVTPQLSQKLIKGGRRVGEAAGGRSRREAGGLALRVVHTYPPSLYACPGTYSNGARDSPPFPCSQSVALLVIIHALSTCVCVCVDGVCVGMCAPIASVP